MFKTAKTLCCATLVALVTVGSFAGTLYRTYEWDFQGSTWTWRLSIPYKAYQFFNDLPRTDDYSIYVTNPYDDQYLASLVDVLEEAAREAGYDEWETINFVVSFVQSLPYTSDRVTTGYDEYPRYPIETLVDRGGDCEDTSILTAALLYQMGYDVILLAFSNHVAVGIWCDYIPGGYYTVDGRDYYYLETTGRGWEIGEIPEERQGETASIIELIPKPLLQFSWKSDSVWWDRSSVIYEIQVTVTNYGSTASWATLCYVALESRPGYVWDQAESDPLTIQPFGRGIYTFSLKCPRGERTKLLVKVWSDNHPIITVQSDWFRP